MAATFLDLPAELRNEIYAYYLAALNITTIHFSRGAYLPPQLTRVSRQVREEFGSYWQWFMARLDLAKIKRLKVRLVNLDYRPLMDFCEKVDRCKKKGATPLFRRVSVTLVFTAGWKAESRCYDELRAWERWVRREGRWARVRPDLWAVRAVFDWGVVDECDAEWLERVLRVRKLFCAEALAVREAWEERLQERPEGEGVSGRGRLWGRMRRACQLGGRNQKMGRL